MNTIPRIPTQFLARTAGTYAYANGGSHISFSGQIKSGMSVEELKRLTAARAAQAQQAQAAQQQKAAAAAAAAVMRHHIIQAHLRKQQHASSGGRLPRRPAAVQWLAPPGVEADPFGDLAFDNLGTSATPRATAPTHGNAVGAGGGAGAGAAVHHSGSLFGSTSSRSGGNTTGAALSGGATQAPLAQTPASGFVWGAVMPFAAPAAATAQHGAVAAHTSQHASSHNSRPHHHAPIGGGSAGVGAQAPAPAPQGNASGSAATPFSAAPGSGRTTATSSAAPAFAFGLPTAGMSQAWASTALHSHVPASAPAPAAAATADDDDDSDMLGGHESSGDADSVCATSDPDDDLLRWLEETNCATVPLAPPPPRSATEVAEQRERQQQYASVFGAPTQASAGDQDMPTRAATANASTLFLGSATSAARPTPSSAFAYPAMSPTAADAQPTLW